MTSPAKIDFDDTIELNPSYFLRWEEAQQSYILLYPEGMVKLNDTAGEILSLVKTIGNVREIVDRLQRKYMGTDIRNDVEKFLESSHAKRWIRVKR